MLQCFGIPVGGLNDQPLGKQVVAGVAGGYLNDVADVSQMFDVFLENYFHV